MIAHTPPGELAVLYYDSITGGRRYNADYLHICDGGPYLALAVADGAGDHADAAEVATITAQIAAAVASSTGSPVEALHAAKHYVDARNHPVPPGQEGTSTATVLAINRYSGVSLAWAGDSPVWGATSSGDVVRLTVPSCRPATPCTVSQQHGELWPHARTIGIDRFARLIVATDGLTTALAPHDRHDQRAAVCDRLADLAGIHHDGGYALAQLLRQADGSLARDNTTIAVIDLYPHRRAATEASLAGRQAGR